MLKKNKYVVITVTLILLSAITLFSLARKEARLLYRDPHVLMDRYYLLRGSNPQAAQDALKIILRQNQNYIPALNELSHIYIKNHDASAALPLVEHLNRLQPNDAGSTFQLGVLYYQQGQWQKASILFNELTQNKSNPISINARNMLDNMASILPYYRIKATVAATQPKAHMENNSQTIQILLSLFYQTKKIAPQQATSLLELLNVLSPNNNAASLEMGYVALQKHQNTKALSYFIDGYNQQPNASIALQIAYLFLAQQQPQQAAPYFLLATQSDDPHIRKIAGKGYWLSKQTLTSETHKQLLALQSKISPDSRLLDQFYHLKKQNKQAAWQLIQHIIQRYPNNITAVTEGGFLAIQLKHRQKAIDYFTQAYRLSYRPDLAMQLGYLYDEGSENNDPITNKYLAYHYFRLATFSQDKRLALTAQNALTNLSGLQTKALPSPYFGEVFFTPFSQDRFGLTVRPFVGRLGIELHDRWQSKLYFVFRQTEDNKSFNAGQIPQIYEDNVRIFGLGLQVTPIETTPLVGFIEVGRAYDLIYRSRDRWRNDVRIGAMYYNEFGTKPAYFEQPILSTHYYSTFYGDITYFSRYNNNIIATVKTHQGIRLAQYHSSMINLYLTGRVIEDTHREFFNNIAELGPGIGFIPSNRYKVELRFEHINGVYLPAGTFNPYGKYYTNNTVQLLYYLKV